MTRRDSETAPLAVGLGESLLRLSAPGHERLSQASHLDVDVGGAEMNALSGLAALGFRCRWLTRLTDSPLGHRIAAHAAEHRVEPIVDWDEDARPSLYFVEHGVPPRPSEVFYDRSCSAMTRLTGATFSWADEVRGAKVAVSTGVTCALGRQPAKAVSDFLAAARNAGACTVFDVDVLFTSRHDLLHLVQDVTDAGDTVELARRAIKQWGHRVVVLRDSTQPAPGLVTVQATAVTTEEVLTSNKHQAQVVDAFGDGDAALAAFIGIWLTEGG